MAYRESIIITYSRLGQMPQISFDTLALDLKNKRQQRRRTVTSAASRTEEHNVNKSISKTISNYFFKPQKIPQAIEERNHYKTLTAKPFFSKNRKLSEQNNRMRKDSNPVMVPSCFKNILRAKSTVIKQKKLQEFYINREGRSDFQRSRDCVFEIDESKTNLFRPNFPKKKSNPSHKNSVHFQRFKKYFIKKELTLDTIDIPRNPLTSFQQISDNLCELALREKISYQNTGQIIQMKKKGSLGNQSVPLKYVPRKKRNYNEKENLQFELEPWAAQDSDDFVF